MKYAQKPRHDPRVRSAEVFLRIDRRGLKRNIGPLLLLVVLFILTLKGMPLDVVLSRVGLPMFWVRLPIAVLGSLYYLRVLYAVVEIAGSLVKRRF